ncbi:hypothetical protein Tco_0837034 [Tanacetum coccineum]
MGCKTETLSLLYENIQYEVFGDLNDGVWGKVCEVWQNVEDICRQVNEELGFSDDEKLRKSRRNGKTVLEMKIGCIKRESKGVGCCIVVKGGREQVKERECHSEYVPDPLNDGQSDDEA